MNLPHEVEKELQELRLQAAVAKGTEHLVEWTQEYGPKIDSIITSEKMRTQKIDELTVRVGNLERWQSEKMGERNGMMFIASAIGSLLTFVLTNVDRIFNWGKH